MVFFVKQKTAYEMRISDWSSDVCSSDLAEVAARDHHRVRNLDDRVELLDRLALLDLRHHVRVVAAPGDAVAQQNNVARGDRKSVVEGKRVSVRVDLGGRRNTKHNNTHITRNILH